MPICLAGGGEKQNPEFRIQEPEEKKDRNGFQPYPFWILAPGFCLSK
jgi:hypothetical protein